MKNSPTLFLIVAILFLFLAACKSPQNPTGEKEPGIPVIFDTDANNELDDQHALAYLLLNAETFNTLGVTVNATRNGGEIDEHVKEAQRIVDLCNLGEKIPVYPGANADFPEIQDQVTMENFDGAAAVNFIIEESKKVREKKLVLLAVGKLTNVALALKKDPSLAEKIRLVWLGSNYPEPGEYNQDNDTASMNYLLNTTVPFEMVTVRYGLPSGTAAVTVSKPEIFKRMPGLGPVAQKPVTGRHGNQFNNFGDYSVSLFEHIEHLGEGQTRALFDMAAVAIVKDPAWASALEIPAPLLVKNKWRERPANERSIIVWENFDREKILGDFFQSLGEKLP
jgi:inosine-uridine nucleoside N-ribohydrolase